MDDSKPRRIYKHFLIRFFFLALAVMVLCAIPFVLTDFQKNRLATLLAKNDCHPMNGTFNITPPDMLMRDVFSCLAADRNDEAARLAFLATAYIHFDVRRLQDDPKETYVEPEKTDGISFIMSDEQRSRLDTSKQALQANPKGWHTFCDELRRVGPPTYYPQYLRFYRTQNRLILRDPKLKIDFDAKQAWHEAVTSVLSCKVNQDLR